MKRSVALLLLLLLPSCRGANTYLETDVAEPPALGTPTASGVKIRAGGFQQGTLLYTGLADMNQVFLEYIETMRGYGWAPAEAEQDPAKGMTARLEKEDRVLTLEIKPVREGVIQVTIRVAPK